MTVPSVVYAAPLGDKLVVPSSNPVAWAVKAAPAAVKTLCHGSIIVEEATTKVPLVPRPMTVPDVVKACPPGARLVPPIAKPEGWGVNVAPAAVYID